MFLNWLAGVVNWRVGVVNWRVEIQVLLNSGYGTEHSFENLVRFLFGESFEKIGRISAIKLGIVSDFWRRAEHPGALSSKIEKTKKTGDNF